MKKLTLISIILFAVIFPPAAWLALNGPMPLEALGEGSRVLYFHVPAAWISVLAFAMAGVYALIYLFRPMAAYEMRFHAAAVLGMFFIVLAVVSGAMWARQTWGAWWSWDPRQTTVAMLMTVYAAYYVLYRALSAQGRSAAISAAYLVFAAVVMPVFVFVLPHIQQGLHPQPLINNAGKVTMGVDLRIILVLNVLAYTFLYLAIFSLMVRVRVLEWHRGFDQ